VGLTGGALVGGSFDMRHADEQEEVLTQLNAAINPGHTVLVAQVNEPSVAVLDKAMADLGGIVVRRSEADVLTELEAADDAADAAQAAARKAVREQKMAEVNQNHEERITALKAKLSRRHEATDQAPKPSQPSA
jgi:long-subunit acyl-CoA synthetase (AMP-forming)